MRNSRHTRGAVGRSSREAPRSGALCPGVPMKAFAELLDRLSYSPSRNAKLRLMAEYFRSTPDPDRGWALAVLTDGLPFSFPLRRTLAGHDGAAHGPGAVPPVARLRRRHRRDHCAGVGAAPRPRSREALAGKAASNRPRPRREAAPSPPRGRGCDRPPRLSEIVSELALVGRNDLAPRLEAWLDQLDATGRWALLKVLDRGAARRRLRAPGQGGGRRDGGPRRR